MANLSVVRTLVLCDGSRSVPATLEELAAAGLHDVVLATAGDPTMVRAAAHVAGATDVEVVGTRPFTKTADRVQLCRRLLGELFLVVDGTRLGGVDPGALLALHRRNGATATMAVVPLRSGLAAAWPHGVVRMTAAGNVESVALGTHADGRAWGGTGVLLCESRAFERWAGGDLVTDTLPALARAGRLFAAPVAHTAATARLAG